MRAKIGTARPGRLRRAVAGRKWSLRQVSLYYVNLQFYEFILQAGHLCITASGISPIDDRYNEVSL